MILKFVFFCLGLNSFPALWAETLESHFLYSLSHARSSAEVERFQLAYEQLKVTRTACHIQLTEHSVPVACYESLSLEDRLSFHDSLRSREDRLRQLDALCRLAAQKLTLAVKDSPSLSLSKPCAKMIQEAREIRAYHDEDSGTWSEN